MARDHPALPAGEHQLRMDFAYDGGGLGKAAPPPCTSTATRSRPAGSNGPTSPCLPSTRPPTSVATLAPRSPTPTPDRQRLHRHRPLGPDRLGRRRPSPPHPTRAVASGGHDPPLARVQASSARATPQLRRDSARHAEQGRAACWVPLHRVRAGEVAWPHLILHGSASVDPCHALELLRHLRLADRGLLAGGVPRPVTELSQGGPAGALRRACRAAGRWTGRPR